MTWQMTDEPHWASEKDAWDNPKGRYSFQPRRGWSCHHCGGLFRGLPSLLEHQERVLSTLSLQESAPPVLAPHNSGERLPSSDAASGGADTLALPLHKPHPTENIEPGAS